MTTKTKAPTRVGASKAKAPVREGLAFLIEDALERSEVVIAAEAIVDKLQGMAEDLSTVEAKDIMPLLDALSNAFGPEVAQSFNGVATEQVRQLIAAVQSAKTALDNEIIRLKHGVEGGEVSDMGMDASAQPMMPGGPPEAGAGMGEPEPGMEGPPAPPGDGLSDVPPGAEAEAGMEVGGNFAGRAKKEGAIEGRKVRGRKIAEAPLGNVNGLPLSPISHPAAPAEPHSHESIYFDDNLNHLRHFNPGAGKLGQNIANMIRSEELSGEQRKALASVLSNFSAFADEPSHWSGVDADAKLKMALQSSGIWKIDSPSVEKVVSQMKRLAHFLSLHHDRMLESNISLLRKATDPDAIILKVFRTKLAENRDSQMAAIRTARTFAIDVEDVVAVVKEAAARRPFPPKLTEFKADINPAKRGMFKGKDIADLKKQRTALKDRSTAAQKRGDKVPADVATKEREVNYAIRAKKGWKGGVDECNEPFGGKQAKPFGKKEDVEEDAPPLMQGVPMFPIDQSGQAAAGTAQSMTPNAEIEGQTEMVPANQSQSTNKPLSPGDMRARQTAQQNAQQQQQAVNQSVQQTMNGNGQPQPTNGQPQQNTQPQQTNTQPKQQNGNTLPYQPPGKVMKPTDPALKRPVQK